VDTGNIYGASWRHHPIAPDSEQAQISLDICILQNNRLDANGLVECGCITRRQMRVV